MILIGTKLYALLQVKDLMKTTKIQKIQKSSGNCEKHGEEIHVISQHDSARLGIISDP